MRNDIDRADQLIGADRARIDASARPIRHAGQLRREFDQPQSDHDAWRVGKERQREQLEAEPMPRRRRRTRTAGAALAERIAELGLAAAQPPPASEG